MTASVYKPSGVKIEILSEYDEGDYLMVRSNTTGKVFFAHKEQVGELLEDDSPKPASNHEIGRASCRERV